MGLPDIYELTLTKTQKKELDRRLDAFDCGEVKTTSWQKVRKKIRMKRK